MPRIFPLAALLVAALASTPASASISVAPQKPSVTADAMHQAYATRWDEAIQQSRSGNTLGALIAMERLMEDPMLDDFDAEHRGRAAQVAGWTAMVQKKPDQARRYLQRAQEALPDDAQILLTLVSVELSENQPAPATKHLVQALKHADAPLPVDHHAINYLQFRLRDQPQQRMELLQALFDNGWKSGGLEPTGLWLALATLQADNGRGEAIPATLARISAPAEIIRLRSDKRFDPYVDRANPRFDPVQAAQKHLDELRVSGLLDRALDARMAEFSSTLLMLDRNEEVLALTDGMAAAAAEGQTVVSGAAELRVKESDRLAAMATGLRALGMQVDETEDGATLHGGVRLGSGTIESHGDHRIAMAFAIAGQISDGEVRINDIANVATSFPDFDGLARGAGFNLG